MLDIINIPFAFLLRLFNQLTGHYLLALLLFALLIKIVLLPFGIGQQKRQIKSAKLRPKIAIIEKKYAGRNDQRTLQKKREEIIALQQAEGVSPFSGCLPMILQLALIMILYSIVTNPLTWVCDFSTATQTNAKAVESVLVTIREALNPNATDLSKIPLPSQLEAMNFLTTPEKLVDGALVNASGTVILTAQQIATLPNFTFLGMDFTAKPFDGGWLVVLPFLVFAVQFATMKVTRIFMGSDPLRDTQSMDRNTKISQWIMDLSMPAMSLFFAFTFPAALGVYWIYQGGLGLLQSFILSKVMPLPTFTEEEIREFERQLKGKAPKVQDENRPRVRSLHHIDDDDYEQPSSEGTAPAQDSKSRIDHAPLKEDDARIERAPLKDEEQDK